jgi:hypothetical protein
MAGWSIGETMTLHFIGVNATRRFARSTTAMRASGIGRTAADRKSSPKSLARPGRSAGRQARTIFSSSAKPRRVPPLPAPHAPPAETGEREGRELNALSP